MVGVKLARNSGYGRPTIDGCQPSTIQTPTLFVRPPEIRRGVILPLFNDAPPHRAGAGEQIE